MLKSDEVLVRVAAAPVNPSDFGSWVVSSSESDSKSFKPRAVGLEGSGVVVRVGSRWSSSLNGISVGCSVGFTGLRDGQGSFSEYVVANLRTTFAMPDELPVEDAAAFFVNPFTAVAILDTVAKEQKDTKAFVHTAGASQLGKMLVKLLVQLRLAGDRAGDIKLISVVRTEDQKAQLLQIGADKVVVLKDPENLKDPGLADLKSILETLKTTVAFDAVAGAMTGRLLSCLPNSSTVYVYGRLAGDIKAVAPIDLIYRQKEIKGFYLRSWLEHGPATTPFFSFATNRLLQTIARVRHGLGQGGWCHSSFVDCDLSTMYDTFKDLATTSGFTNHKLRIRFDLTTGSRFEPTPKAAQGKKKKPFDDDDDA